MLEPSQPLAFSHSDIEVCLIKKGLFIVKRNSFSYFT